MKHRNSQNNRRRKSRVDPSEQYLTKVIQLQHYLLNESGYSVSELNELDMDFDGTLTALDLVLLKKMILSD